MSVVTDARDELIAGLKNLEDGSDELLKQGQVIKILSEIDLNDRKLEFDMEKEETRKLEKSNETVYSQTDKELRKLDLGIRFLDAILDPWSLIARTLLNNHTRVKRDVMGYQFEETGVISSHTLSNAQKDKYD